MAHISLLRKTDFTTFTSRAGKNQTIPELLASTSTAMNLSRRHAENRLEITDSSPLIRLWSYSRTTKYISDITTRWMTPMTQWLIIAKEDWLQDLTNDCFSTCTPFCDCYYLILLQFKMPSLIWWIPFIVVQAKQIYLHFFKTWFTWKITKYMRGYCQNHIWLI